MDQTLNLGPAAPQVSSHSSPLAPLPASVLLEQELDRKDRLCKKGNLVTGCRELDEYVLLGGFERGSVVGVSAEEDDVGMLVSFLRSELAADWIVVDSLIDWSPDNCQYAGFGAKFDSKGNGHYYFAGKCAAPEAADGFGQSAFC